MLRNGRKVVTAALADLTHDELVRLYQSGAIAPMIGASYAFSELPAALAEIAERRSWGKVIIEMTE